MKVTRLIREYVEKKVNESYPKTVAELEWEEHDKSLDEAVTEARERVFEFAKKVAEEVSEKYGFPTDSNLMACDNNRSIGRRYNSNSEIYQAYYKAREERKQKIDEKIEEILLTLELGGSKAELDEMLANIGK
jgi:Fe2+ transport system protein B